MKLLNEEWGIDSDWTLFLDRDGTINRRLDGYITNWEQFHFLPNSTKGISELCKIFGKIVIVTNQQGIDKEVMTHDDLQSIHENMLQYIEYFDGRIDAIYYEPSLAAYDAFGRKPNPGMAMNAQKDFPTIDFKKSVMIGDTMTDIEFGNKLGMKTVWIENIWEKKDRHQILEKCDLFVGDLYQFSSLI